MAIKDAAPPEALFSLAPWVVPGAYLTDGRCLYCVLERDDAWVWLEDVRAPIDQPEDPIKQRPSTVAATLRKVTPRG